MGERSGIGVVECAILEALDSLGARPGRGARVNARVLAVVEDRIGLAPGYAYEVLLDLARPWVMPLRLVRGGGNFGSRGNDPPANFRYTESLLSPAGQVALAAERGDLAPVPIGLINGSVYREGIRPPFRPRAIIEALREVIQRPRITGKDLIAIIGPPCFLNGAAVTGDFAALAAGRQVVLRLESRVTVSDDHGSVLITNVPPNASPDDTATSLANLAMARHWASSHPDSTGKHACRSRTYATSPHRDETLTCSSASQKPGTTAEQLRDQLLDVYGVYTEVHVALPRPLATMIRGWAKAYSGEDLLASLTALENAIRAQDESADGRA